MATDERILWAQSTTGEDFQCVHVDDWKDSQARIAALEAEARFLLARLNELEFSDLDDVYRDFYGHVGPSMARLGELLDNKA